MWTVEQQLISKFYPERGIHIVSERHLLLFSVFLLPVNAPLSEGKHWWRVLEVTSPPLSVHRPPQPWFMALLNSVQMQAAVLSLVVSEVWRLQAVCSRKLSALSRRNVSVRMLLFWDSCLRSMFRGGVMASGSWTFDSCGVDACTVLTELCSATFEMHSAEVRVQKEPVSQFPGCRQNRLRSFSLKL